MVIGLQHAMVDTEDQPAKMKTRRLARDFFREFESLHGSIKCRDLLECDIGTPEGMDRARQERLFETVCPEFVKDAIQILESIE
jgi:hypothetical protein